MKIFINNIYIYNHFGNVNNFQGYAPDNRTPSGDDSPGIFTPRLVNNDDHPLIAYLQEQLVKSKQELKELRENYREADNCKIG